MKDTKVIFMGTPDFAVPILDFLIKNTNVVLVVTQPDKEVGREKKLTISPVKKLALENNIDIFQPIKIKNDYEIIKEEKPDIIVTCAYGQIIPKEILDIPTLGAINVHASLLPKLRGASPIQWALLCGHEKTGITIMYMDEKMDTGDIIEMFELPIEKDDNVGSLHDKLSALGVRALETVLPKIIAGTNNRTKQNEEEATYTKMIKREDEKIDFNDLGKNIINKIRAFTPWPLTYIKINDLEIKIIEAEFIEGNPAEVGKITYEKKRLLISCKDGFISLKKVKPNGKKEMDITSYLNGSKRDCDYVN